MTKPRLILALVILSPLFAAAQLPDSLTFSNQTITVRPDQLALDAVRFVPEAVVTNTALEWVELVEIATNELHAGLGDYVVSTNTVSRQVATDILATNAAHWVADVQFKLPRGHEWALNGLPVVVDRFAVNIAVELPEATVQAALPDYYAALVFAASSGNYQPTGPMRAAFLGLGAQALATGQ